MSLIAADKANSGVQSENHPGLQVFSNGGLLQLANMEASAIALTDLVGRTIRTWQFPRFDVPREITLNVADVPSGVYFLRVTGGGVDEVKKVCITH